MVHEGIQLLQNKYVVFAVFDSRNNDTNQLLTANTNPTKGMGGAIWFSCNG